MKTRSAKEKGKRLEKHVAERVVDVLGQHNVKAKRMPMSGAIPGFKSDVLTNLPVSFECKNQEKVQLWEWWGQASSQAGSKIPVLIVSRNRVPEPLAIITLEDLLFFMELAAQAGWLRSSR